MFEKIKTFASEHPWGLAGIIFVIGVILIWLFWPRSNGATATTADPNASYYNAQAAAVQAGGQVYAAQIAANAQTDQAKTEADLAAKIAGFQSDVANNQINAQRDLGLAQITEQGHEADVGLQTVNAQSTAATALAKIAADSTTTIATINANRDISITNANDAIASHVADLNATTARLASTQTNYVQLYSVYSHDALQRFLADNNLTGIITPVLPGA